MPTFSTHEIAGLLRSSGLVRGEEAAGLLVDDSAGLIAESEIAFEQLLATYSIRLAILHQASGPVTQLLDSISEMCGRLRQYQGDCCLLRIEAPYWLTVLVSSDGRRR
jgi:hypothetical protein